MEARRSQLILQPEVLRWARERAGLSPAALVPKVVAKAERVVEWEKSGAISMAQADGLARITHTPLGYLFLSTPPVEPLTIRDFRIRAGAAPAPPSRELLETVYAMQRRQAWLRKELIETGHEPLGFVGRHRRSENFAAVAAEMRATLAPTADWSKARITWSDALAGLRDALDAIGVLVVCNGVAGNYTRRGLNRDEFQGFALADEYAPLIFINNADFKAVQMFTLARALAHLFVGEGGVSAVEYLLPSEDDVERFCDASAAEFLLPEAELREFWGYATQFSDPYQRVVRRFKVSRVVAARRAFDLELIDRETFFDCYNRYKRQGTPSFQDTDSGDFWNTQRWRIGPRFAGHIVRAVRAGRLPHREAYALTGLMGDNFDNMPERLGIRI